MPWDGVSSFPSDFTFYWDLQLESPIEGETIPFKVDPSSIKVESVVIVLFGSSSPLCWLLLRCCLYEEEIGGFGGFGSHFILYFRDEPPPLEVEVGLLSLVGWCCWEAFVCSLVECLCKLVVCLGRLSPLAQPCFSHSVVDNLVGLFALIYNTVEGCCRNDVGLQYSVVGLIVAWMNQAICMLAEGCCWNIDALQFSIDLFRLIVAWMNQVVKGSRSLLKPSCKGCKVPSKPLGSRPL